LTTGFGHGHQFGRDGVPRRARIRTGSVLSRTETLLGCVSKQSRIIEIGPSFNPIAPKSGGWNSASIDHLSREGLVAKYSANSEIDFSRIETVDFVWTGGLLSDAVPSTQHGSFDVFLASHVIEHTPDLVAFLDAAEVLLKEDGVVILAVPDKRYCFDYFQQLTTTGQVLDAHAKQRTRHSGERAFDHYAYAATDGGAESWGQRASRGIRFIHELENAGRVYSLLETTSDYHDLHAWHFVPPSFELILLELAALGETDWRVERISPTAGWEFFAWLRRGARAEIGSMSVDELQSQRSLLLKRTLLQTQAQIDWLLASEPQLARELGGDSSWLTHDATAAALERTRREVSELRDRLSSKEREYAAALQRIAALEASTSWRATAPLRRLLAPIRRPRAARAKPTK
jgi:SAM-dependent methyltransferase